MEGDGSYSNLQIPSPSRLLSIWARMESYGLATLATKIDRHRVYIDEGWKNVMSETNLALK